MSDVTINKKDKIFPRTCMSTEFNLSPYSDKLNSVHVPNRFKSHSSNVIPVRLGDEITYDNVSSSEKYLQPFMDPKWISLVDDNAESSYKNKSISNVKEPMRKKKLKSIYEPINFWFEDPKSLFETCDIIPQSEMTNAERLNAMTRIIVIITAIMFSIRFPLWWYF